MGAVAPAWAKEDEGSGDTGGDRRRGARGWPGALGSALQAAATAFTVVVLTFLLVRAIPGDPVVAMTGGRSTERAREELRSQLRLDESLPSQFVSYIGDLAQGDLGSSLIRRGQPVAEIIAGSLPVTGALILVTIVISCLIGVPLGVVAAAPRGRRLDGPIRGLLALLLTTPPFLMGLILILLVALGFGLLPAGGWSDEWPLNVKYLILPSLALSAYLTPLLARATRQASITAQQELWVEVALARGISSWRLAWTLILRRCWTPVITVLGFNVGQLISGAVVVEAVFGLPGLGTELLLGIRLRDYPVVQGMALVTALLVIVCNLVADLVIGALDPRTRR